jgi:dGTPase
VTSSRVEAFQRLLESTEVQNVKPYGLRSAERRDQLGTMFRASPTKAPLEYRSEYHRDRDRIVWSKSLKRLQHKTQIFPHYFEDHYKRRLTHSLEVAQIATTLARALGLNEVLAEAIALAHDLGHTPFGHAGETALNERLQEECRNGGIDSHNCPTAINGFDHCVHGIQVVSRIEQEYTHENQHGGLNLTFDVRDGILKHMFTRPFDPQRPLSTMSQVTDIPEYATYRPNNGSLEAQCVYLADKLAYLFGDIEDGVRSRILDCAEIAKHEFFERLRQKHAVYRTDSFPEFTKPTDFSVFRSAALTVLILDCIDAATERIEDCHFENVDDVLICPQRIVQVDPEMEKSIGSFYDQWMRNFPFKHEDVVACEFKAKRIVADLFDAYFGDQYLINEAYRRQCKQAYADICEPESLLLLLILVRNYIGGMTDFFAIQQHGRLYMSSERIAL